MNNEVVGFQWDDGNWPKCGKHGVDRLEIEYAVSTAHRIVDDPSTTEKRFRTVGKTMSGRYVFIVFTVRQSEVSLYIRPISARYMHDKEIERYEEGMAGADQ